MARKKLKYYYITTILFRIEKLLNKSVEDMQLRCKETHHLMNS